MVRISDEILGPSDVSFYDLVIKAMKEATRYGIKANSIVINRNMVRVPEQYGEWPEMICGLHCYFTADELPDGCTFAVCHNANVDAAKVMHGRWLDKTEVITNLHFPRVDCSVCGHIFWHISALSYNYCPNCGADMRERKDNDL